MPISKTKKLEPHLGVGFQSETVDQSRGFGEINFNEVGMAIQTACSPPAFGIVGIVVSVTSCGEM
jgi:hypothetical protein